jgi:PLP dependent protein
VRLVAVTKTITPARIAEALAAGQLEIGENRVQEAETKFPELINGPWASHWCRHLIGHLQANKARRAVELFDWIHSIDSVKLAARLDRIAGELGRRPVVLAQVDIGHEATKNGIDESELPELADYLAGAAHLDFRGLMAIPPYLPDLEAVRPFFSHLRELKEQLQQRGNLTLPELSMGMSHDFEVAIEEGATLVRVGSAIFGARAG